MCLVSFQYVCFLLCPVQFFFLFSKGVFLSRIISFGLLRFFFRFNPPFTFATLEKKSQKWRRVRRLQNSAGVGAAPKDLRQNARRDHLSECKQSCAPAQITSERSTLKGLTDPFSILHIGIFSTGFVFYVRLFFPLFLLKNDPPGSASARPTRK